MPNIEPDREAIDHPVLKLLPDNLLAHKELQAAIASHGVAPPAMLASKLGLKDAPLAPTAVHLSANTPTSALASVSFVKPQITSADHNYVQFAKATFAGAPMPAPDSLVVLTVSPQPGYLYAVDASLLVQPGGTVRADQPDAA